MPSRLGLTLWAYLCDCEYYSTEIKNEYYKCAKVHDAKTGFVTEKEGFDLVQYKYIYVSETRR